MCLHAYLKKNYLYINSWNHRSRIHQEKLQPKVPKSDDNISFTYWKLNLSLFLHKIIHCSLCLSIFSFTDQNMESFIYLEKFFFLTQSLLKESLSLLTIFYSLLKVNLCILALFVIVSSCLYPNCTPLALIKLWTILWFLDPFIGKICFICSLSTVKNNQICSLFLFGE